MSMSSILPIEPAAYTGMEWRTQARRTPGAVTAVERTAGDKRDGDAKGLDYKADTGKDKRRQNDSSALTPREEKIVEELKKRDAEVRRHEMAHLRAAGPYGLVRSRFVDRYA